MAELGDGVLRRPRSTARVGEQVRREHLGLTSSTQEHGHVEGHAAEDGTGGHVSSRVGARAAHGGHINFSSNRWRVLGLTSWSTFLGYIQAELNYGPSTKFVVLVMLYNFD
jgi:hypothetical protein